MDHLTEMLKGILEGCILEIISHKAAYGYEITRELHRMGLKDVVEGTVYAVLLRFEKNDWVQTEKRPSSLGPPRKVYVLNAKGEAERIAFWERWQFLTQTIEKWKKEQQNEEIL